MKRRRFLGVVATAIAAPRSAFAQKTPVIGLLWNDSVKPSPYVAVLEAALKERGYVRGRNVRFEDAVALEGYGPMAPNAARLVGAKVDLIVANGATATLAAAKATRQIPIVTIIGTDPTSTGLAASLSRPGSNVTGIWTRSASLNGKRVELLKELAPRTERLGILLAPGSTVQAAVKEAEAAAASLRMTTVRAEVGSGEDIEPAIAKLARARVDAITVMSSMLTAHSQRVAALINARRIPAIYLNDRFVDAGGLLFYGTATRKSFHAAAGYVDRILKGARPAEMPIEQTSDVELVINLKTARELGLAVPAAILQRADRAIQ